MMISFARAGPTRRTNRVVDATPRGTPRSTSGIQSCASAAAQRKSQASVTFSPMRADGITGRATGAITSRARERPASGARLCEEPERRLRGPEARKKRCDRRAEMACRDLGEKGAEVRRHGEVTALEEL